MSVRDEMAWGLAKKLFPGLPWDQLYPLKQNVCLELADALMPIVERVVLEACQQYQCVLYDAVLDDCENGVRWLNQQAAEEFKAKYPELHKAIGANDFDEIVRRVVGGTEGGE